jgi:hypothetical protein
MTDKEIAAKLSLSPETVGTYWRRILSKYSAASRTEVVAKVVRLQAEASMTELEEVNACLKEVADHLLVVLSGRDVEPEPARPSLPEIVLGVLPSLVVAVDQEGFCMYVNRQEPGVALEVGAPLEWSVDAEDREALQGIVAKVLEGGEAETSALRVLVSGQPVPFQGYFTQAVLDDEPVAVVSLSRSA